VNSGRQSARRSGKGDDRPINTLADRMAVIAALESVALVTSFDEYRRSARILSAARTTREGRRLAPTRSWAREVQSLKAAGALDRVRARPPTTKLLSKIRA
jgi:hypothetical protein